MNASNEVPSAMVRPYWLAGRKPKRGNSFRLKMLKCRKRQLFHRFVIFRAFTAKGYLCADH